MGTALSPRRSWDHRAPHRGPEPHRGRAAGRDQGGGHSLSLRVPVSPRSLSLHRPPGNGNFDFPALLIVAARKVKDMDSEGKIHEPFHVFSEVGTGTGMGTRRRQRCHCRVPSARTGSGASHVAPGGEPDGRGGGRDDPGGCWSTTRVSVTVMWVSPLSPRASCHAQVPAGTQWDPAGTQPWGSSSPSATLRWSPPAWAATVSLVTTSL